VRRRRVAAVDRHARRAEAAGAAASDEEGVEAGKRVYCLSGGALFSASIAFAVSQPSASVDGERNTKGRERREEVTSAEEEARWSVPEGPGLIGAGREGVLGASGVRERDCFGGGWLR